MTYTYDFGTIAENDVLGIKFNGSGGSIDVHISDTTPSMSNQEIRYLDTTTWNNNSYFVIGSIGSSLTAWTERGTAI